MYFTVVAKFLVLNKPWFRKYMAEETKKLTYMTFLYMIALRNKTLAHTFLLSFNNANGRLFQERLPTVEHDVTLLLSIGDRHKNCAIGCPIDEIF